MDANNIAFRDTTSPIDFILDCVLCGVRDGIEMNVIADNRSSHHSSKRASYKRSADRERARLDVQELNVKLNTGLQNNIPSGEVDAIAEQLKKAESKSKRGLMPNFTQMLQDRVASLDYADLAKFREAYLQADPVIARRYICRESDLVMSNDSDFFTHHHKITLIHQFKRNKKDGKLYSIELATASSETSALITKILKERYEHFKSVDIFSVPKFPIFDKEEDAECRSLISCAMGNDYWIGGQNKFGPSAAMDLLNNANNEEVGRNAAHRRNYILYKISHFKKSGASLLSCEKTISTYAKAFLYEPAREVGHQQDRFVHCTPSTLPYFLADFQPLEGCTIEAPENSAPVATCVFLGEESHTFMESEGVLLCGICANSMCTHCTTKAKDQNNVDITVCFDCRKATIGDSRIDLNMTKMINEIVSVGSIVPSKATFAQVRDLHESIVLNNEIGLCQDEIASRKFPVYSMDVIGSDELFQLKISGSVREFSRAVSSEHLSDDEACRLIHLCAELVRFEEKEQVWGKKYKIHGVMPSMLIKFCEGSRVHGGLRLMKRACRHSVYQHDPDMRDAFFEIGTYKGGDIYLRIAKDVAASYHRKSDKKTYRTEVICTSSELLCTRCNCKAGAKIDLKCSIKGPKHLLESHHDRHTDVHNMVCLYGMTKELLMGLSEQLLVEFNLRVLRSDNALAMDSDLTRKDIQVLFMAAMRKKPLQRSVEKMLQEFSVTTDRTCSYPGSPKKSSIRRLRDCEYISPQRAMRNIMLMKNSKNAHFDNSTDIEPPVNHAHNGSTGIDKESFMCQAASEATKLLFA